VSRRPALYHRLAALVTVTYWLAEMTFMDRHGAPPPRQERVQPRFHHVNKKDLQDIIGMFAWFFGRGPKPQFDATRIGRKFDYISLAIGTVIIGVDRLHDVGSRSDHAGPAGHLPDDRSGHPFQRGPAPRWA